MYSVQKERGMKEGEWDSPMAHKRGSVEFKSVTCNSANEQNQDGGKRFALHTFLYLTVVWNFLEIVDP